MFGVTMQSDGRRQQDHDEEITIVADATLQRRGEDCIANPRTLLLLAIHPLPSTSPLHEFHSILKENIRHIFDSNPSHLKLSQYIHLYGPENLHVTIGTLNRDAHPNCQSHIASEWASCIANLKGTKLKLCDSVCVFNDGVAVLLWHDVNETIVSDWRRVLNRTNSIVFQDDMKLTTPNIIHSTLFRWKVSPPKKVHVEFIRGLVHRAFEATISSFGHVDIVVDVNELHVVEEVEPCLSQSICHHVIGLC